MAPQSLAVENRATHPKATHTHRHNQMEDTRADPQRSPKPHALTDPIGHETANDDIGSLPLRTMKPPRASIPPTTHDALSIAACWWGHSGP